MSKNWSSFEGQQLLHENWRKFLSEESSTAKFFRDAGFTTDDHWDKDSEEAEGAEGKLGYGLDSERNAESLLTFLRRGAPFLKTAQAQSLIAVMAQVAEDEGIMLELSLKGLNSEQDRIIDSAGTAEILATIASFGLKPQQQNKLLKTLNHWGRMNSIKFTAPPAAPPPVTGDLPNADQEAGEESGEEGVMSKIKNVGGKIQDVATSDAVKALEGTLDAASLIPGANLPASIASALVNLAQGEPKEAALSLLSIIPLGGVAGKLGKFGPILMKLAPAIKTFNKARGAKGAKAALQIALDKAGADASVEDLQKASKTAIDFYDKLSSLPGVGEQLQDTIGPYVEPLRGAQEFLDTPEPSGMPDSESEWKPPEEWENLTTGEEEWVASQNPDQPSSSDVIDLDNKEALKAMADDPTAPPGAPGSPGNAYDRGSGEVYISKIPYPGTHGWDAITDNTWALYRDLTPKDSFDEEGNITVKAPESGLFAFSPKSERHPHGVWVPDGIEQQKLTNLPIKEEIEIFERWHAIAGIKKRVS